MKLFGKANKFNLNIIPVAISDNLHETEDNKISIE